MILQIPFFQSLERLSIIELLILILLVIIISLLFYSLFLKIALSFVKSKHTDINDIFSTALICAILTIIPFIGCILCWFVIYTRHELDNILVAIAVWVLAIVIGIIISIFITIAIVGIMGIPFRLI